MYNCKNCVHAEVCNKKAKYELRCRDLESLTKGWEFNTILECPNHLASFELNQSREIGEAVIVDCSGLIPTFRQNVTISNLNIPDTDKSVEDIIKDIKQMDKRLSM